MVTFDDVATVNPRKAVDLEPHCAVTFIPMAAVSASSGEIERYTSRRVADVYRDYRQFAENDVIFAKITPSMENGKAAVAIGLDNGIGFGSTEFHVLRSNGAVLAEYLWRFVRQRSFRDDAQRVMSGAVGQQRVPADYLRTHALPLPPLEEQRRIVSKIESLIACTSRARASLEQIPGLIQWYKSQVFELAFTGKLTLDFREKPGLQNVPSDSFPSGWVMKSLGELGQIQVGVQVGKRTHTETDLVNVPYLRVANVQRGWLDLDNVRNIEVTPAERDRLLLRPGDILLNEGGDRDKLGRGWVWAGQMAECIHQNHVFRVRLFDRTFPPSFVSYYANEKGQQYFFDQGTQTTNLASVSKRHVAALRIPVPPVDEASAIVDRIDSAFGWVERLSAKNVAATTLLEQLDESILSDAFRGALVSQNPRDEPASVLVARCLARQPSVRRKTKTKPLVMPKEFSSVTRRLIDVLLDATDWIPAQEAFRRCGITDGADTDSIELLYSELRALDRAGRIKVQPVTDSKGRKLHDRLKLQDG